MGSPLRRLVRLGLPAVAVLAAALAGCGEPAAAPVAPPASPAPTLPSGTPTGVPTVAGSTGSDGLTVRYLGDDGDVKTVRVEDFPR
jgi:hypothetical protein